MQKSRQDRHKIGLKLRSDRRKILCGARRRKERKFYSENPCGKISPLKARSKPPKARQKSAKRLKSRRKILAPKFRPQISPGRIALDGAGFELAANFPG